MLERLDVEEEVIDAFVEEAGDRCLHIAPVDKSFKRSLNKSMDKIILEIHEFPMCYFDELLEGVRLKYGREKLRSYLELALKDLEVK